MKKLGIALVVLGIILLAGTIVWMTVGVGLLMRVPSGIDDTTYYEGEVTWYVNPMTNESLPAGEELVIPLSVERLVKSLDDEYTSDTAVIQEKIIMSMMGQQQELVSVYVLDRKNQLNVADNRAYDYVETNKVDRVGTYYPLLPMGVNRDEVYSVWAMEVSRGVDSVYIDDAETNGLTLAYFEGSVELEDLSPAFIEVGGFPSEVSLDDVKSMLSGLGVNLDEFLALAMQVMTPEDQQVLQEASQTPIPVNYYWTGSKDVGMDVTTGTPVDLRLADEFMSMEVDMNALLPLFSTLMKYSSDPTLGPAIQQLASLQGQLLEAEPQKVLHYIYSQTEESVAKTADSIKDALGLIRLAKTYVPIAGFVLAGIFILVGAWLAVSSKRKETA